MYHRIVAAVLVVLSATAPGLRAETVTVATASNFAATVEVIAEQFEIDTGHRVRLSFGSTGKLYAQIVNGAPYDVFLAADAERPALLEASGLAAAGSRSTYAIGTLVLYSRHPSLEGRDCREQLDRLGTRRLAIANPVTAPYGAAAKQFLEREGLYESVQANLVIGENIGQTLSFAATGNAELGLIARAQLESPELPPPTCLWDVPPESHDRIEQQSVLLSRATGNAAAIAFLDYLASPAVRKLISESGYLSP